jgi:shikimate dehydrogenase
MPSLAVQSVLALFGSPVGGNPTQYMFEQAFTHHGLDWRYLTFEIDPKSLGQAVGGLRALGFRGGHCADPHKEAIIPWLDRVSDTAALVGAVNLMLREENALIGENTEGKGALQAIRGILDPAGKRIVLLGAGRMARATAIELAAAGAEQIMVVNRSESRASDLASLLKDKFKVPASASLWRGEYSVPEDADILIHAAGVEGHANDASPPLVLDTLRPELLVADAAADSPHTCLLAEAVKRGCKTVDGLSMFIEQAAIGFHLWTGVNPDHRVLREAVEEFLEL